MKKMKKFIFVFLISLAFIPIGVKAEYNYGGKVVVKWVDAHNKLNMRPDEITIPLTGEDWEYKTIKYDLTLNKKDALITEEGIYTYWTFNIAFPLDSSRDLRFGYDTAKGFDFPKGYKSGFDYFVRGELGCLDRVNCNPEAVNELEILLIKDVAKDIPVKAIFNDDNGRDNYRYIYFYMNGKNTIGTNYSFDGKVQLKVDEYDYVMELIQYLVTDVSDNELEKIDYEYGILESVYDLTDASYEYTVEALENGDIIYTINHKAERIKVPIKINWLDDNNIYGKRPNNLAINTVNQYGEIEEKVELTNENWDTYLDLFKNIKYSFGEEQIKYSLDIANTKDYEYKVEKVDDGFVVTAQFIGEKIIPDNNIDENPQTYDNINSYVLMLLIGISGMAISINKIRRYN